VQLQGLQQEFDRAGFSLVAMTYDSPEILAAFVAEETLKFPLLSDVEALSFQALGILNQDYTKGDDHYGIPYPGIFVVDRDAQIRAKFFVAPYAERIDGKAVLAAIRNLDP
jgi:peroxiredoxin